MVGFIDHELIGIRLDSAGASTAARLCEPDNVAAVDRQVLPMFALGAAHGSGPASVALDPERLFDAPIDRRDKVFPGAMSRSRTGGAIRCLGACA
jgi:hypothetical protein